VTYHIQFDLDVGHKAQAVATAAKIGREWVIAGLHDMWAHCFRVRGNTVSDMLLTGFFGAPIGHVPALVGDRRSHQVASQGSIPLYSTRRLALMALRHELEKVAAQTLRNIDKLLEADLARFRVERPAGGAS